MWTANDTKALGFDPATVAVPLTDAQLEAVWAWMGCAEPAGPETQKLTPAELRAVRREGSALAWEASR